MTTPNAPTLAPPPWAFDLLPGETLPNRARRLWQELLEPGPMGYKLRADVYAYFVNCQQVPAGLVGTTPVQSIASWATSCAIVQRAFLYWLGKRPPVVARNGQGIFAYLGLAQGDASWVTCHGATDPRVPELPAILYWASNGTNGHVECVYDLADGDLWLTAGGGGGTDGTGTSLRTHVHGQDHYGRPLQGWWELSRVPGIPASPPPQDDPGLLATGGATAGEGGAAGALSVAPGGRMPPPPVIPRPPRRRPLRRDGLGLVTR